MDVSSIPNETYLYPELTRKIIGCAMHVQTYYGPWYVEYVYQKALERMLLREGIPFEAKKKVPVFFEGEDIGAVLELDILVDSKIILELKSLDKLTAANERQIISYLKATGKEVGLLINFGESRLKWKRFVNTSPIKEDTPQK